MYFETLPDSGVLRGGGQGGEGPRAHAVWGPIDMKNKNFKGYMNLQRLYLFETYNIWKRSVFKIR